MDDVDVLMWCGCGLITCHPVSTPDHARKRGPVSWSPPCLLPVRITRLPVEDLVSPTHARSYASCKPLPRFCMTRLSISHDDSAELARWEGIRASNSSLYPPRLVS
jgi:hypothetical protein